MKTKALILLALTALTAACTGVDVVEQVQPHVKVICQADWSQMPGDRPDTFSVAVARSMRSIHRYWEKVAMDSNPVPDTLRLPAGEYQNLLFGSEDPGNYIFENTLSFAKDSITSMRSLSARLRKLSKEECERVQDYRGLMLNYMDTIPQAPELYVSHIRENLQENAGLVQYVFKPAPMVQEIHLKIKLEYAQNSVPNEVFGCITGLAHRAELMSGYMNMESMGQTWFEMENAGNDVWEATVRVLGVRISDDPATVDFGPGLLRLGIDTGIKHVKLIHRENLYRVMKDAPSLETTDDEGFFQGGARILNYDLTATPFKINVAEESDQGGEDPVNPWEDPDDGQTKEILDGDDDDHD